MLDVRPGRKHDGVLKEKIAGLFKRNGARSGEIDLARLANLSDRCFDSGRIDRGRLVARQT